jgi:hypothetical protein
LRRSIHLQRARHISGGNTVESRFIEIDFRVVLAAQILSKPGTADSNGKGPRRRLRVTAPCKAAAASVVRHTQHRSHACVLQRLSLTWLRGAPTIPTTGLQKLNLRIADYYRDLDPGADVAELTTASNLLRFASVVLFAVDIGVVFYGLQVSRDFGGHP